MKVRKTVAALCLLVLLPTTVACTAEASTLSSGSTTSTSQSSDTTESGAASSDDAATSAGSVGDGAGPGGGVDVSSVATEDELVALIQEAYGDAGLGLHRGHEPVQDVLDEVLTISHDELHVRMEEQGQNLAAVAEDIGVNPQTLVDALVDSWSPAIDSLLANGTITQDAADAYLAALEEAFSFRVNWDGQEATPTFTGIDA